MTGAASPVGQLCSLVSRGVAPAYADSGVIVINQKCIRHSSVDIELARFSDLGRRRVPFDKYLRVYDVLVNSTGVGTLGRVAIVRRLAGPTTVDSHVTIVRPDPAKVDPLFFGYAMVANQPTIERMGVGATGQTELSARRLAQEVFIPRLPMIVQQRVALILSAYDELLDNCRRRIRVLEELVRVLYREWFELFRYPGHQKGVLVPSALGPVPKGWSVAPLAELSSFLGRGIAPRYSDAGPSIVINQKCIRNQRLTLTQARRQQRPIPAAKLVRPGDVLINSTGVGTLGRVAQVMNTLDNTTVDTHVTIVRPIPELDPAYFGCALLAMQPTFERMGIGATGQTELGRGAIGSTEICVPPRPLRDRFAQLIRPMRDASESLERRAENLKSSRDLLLPRLLSGKIRLEDVG